MLLYIFITATVVAMSYFINSSVRKKNMINLKTASVTRQELLNIVLLTGIFIILFALSALRIGIGNDYWEYRYRFLDIAGGQTPVSYEIGFRGVVLLMQKCFGLDNYRTTFAFFAFVTVFFALKGMYETSDWFFYTFFLFMMNGFYFMSFSNVRYYFAFSVICYSMKYFFKKQYVAFIIWVIVAALFHKTALLVIPVYFVAYYLKWSKKTIWIIPFVCGVLIAFEKPIRWLLFKIYPYYEGDEILDSGSVSIMNIAKCAAILILCLMFYRSTVKGNAKAEMLFNLNLFALVIYSFASYIPELSRICYYMVLGSIFLIPIVLKGIENKTLKRLMLAGVSLAYILYFIVFLVRGRNPVIMFLPYLTWLFT